MKPRCFSFGLCYLLCSFISLSAADERIIGDFSSQSLEGWEEKSFDGSTTYTLVSDNGNPVLAAKSSDSASGLFKKININLMRTPILEWSWKTDHVFTQLDETSREGDDYPARIYIVFSDGPFFWQTFAINYVWSGNQPLGSSWLNAYTDHAVMIAVESGIEHQGQWRHYRRNVLQDIERYHGKKVNETEAVAIMVDTDNSGLRAITRFGDIRFTSETSTVRPATPWKDPH